MNSLYVVIIGCGRLGSRLANRLSAEAHSVVVVDVDESGFENLAPEYSGFRIQGDATELSLLKQAKIGKADLVIATTRDDNINMMIVQLAMKLFGVPRGLARLYDPNREEMYRTLGIETVCPTTLAMERLLRAVAGAQAGRAGGEP